jgi:hypothetical protein
VQADRRAKLAEAQQVPMSVRRTHNRSALLLAGGHPLGQTFTRLFGKPSKSVITKLHSPSAPASSLLSSRDLNFAPQQPLPMRSAPPRPAPGMTMTAAPEGPADPLSAFSSTGRGAMAAEKRPPQVGQKRGRRF